MMSSTEFLHIFVVGIVIHALPRHAAGAHCQGNDDFGTCPSTNSLDASALLQGSVRVAQAGMVSSLKEAAEIAKDLHADEVNSTGSAKGQVVLGMACSYRKSDIVVFISSLRTTGYQGPVLIGMDSDIDAETRSFLQKNNVESRSEPCVEQLQQQSTILGGMFGDLNFRRYHYYKKWIASGQYTDVWMLGVKDVFFQANPFSKLSSSLGFFPMTWEMTEHQAKWVESCFGFELKEQMIAQGSHNMCMDTVAGKADRVINFCEKMIVLYDDLRRLQHATPNTACNMANEQPAANLVIFQSGGPRYAVLHKLYEGQAVTFFPEGGGACVPGDVMRQDADGQLLNSAGNVMPVLHRWGACNTTRALVNQRMQRHGYHPRKSSMYAFDQDLKPIAS